MRPKRSVPPDFAAQARQLRTIRALCAHYRASSTRVRRWQDECPVQPAQPEPPADLPGRAQLMSLNALMRHYRVGRPRLTEWLDMAGIARDTLPVFRGGPSPKPTARPARKVQLALNYLRAQRLDAVWDGGPDYALFHGGKRWVVGRMRLDADAVVALAVKRGWRPQ